MASASFEETPGQHERSQEETDSTSAKQVSANRPKMPKGTQGYDGNLVAREVEALLTQPSLTFDIVPRSWLLHLRKPNSSHVDRESITLLAWLVGQHRLAKNGGAWFAGNRLQLTRAQLASLFGVSIDTAGGWLDRLVAHGVIKKHVEDAMRLGRKDGYNVPFIELNLERLREITHPVRQSWDGDSISLTLEEEATGRTPGGGMGKVSYTNTEVIGSRELAASSAAAGSREWAVITGENAPLVPREDTRQAAPGELQRHQHRLARSENVRKDVEEGAPVFAQHDGASGLRQEDAYHLSFPDDGANGVSTPAYPEVQENPLVEYVNGDVLDGNAGGIRRRLLSADRVLLAERFAQKRASDVRMVYVLVRRSLRLYPDQKPSRELKEVRLSLSSRVGKAAQEIMVRAAGLVWGLVEDAEGYLRDLAKLTVEDAQRIMDGEIPERLQLFLGDESPAAARSVTEVLMDTSLGRLSEAALAYKLAPLAGLATDEIMGFSLMLVERTTTVGRWDPAPFEKALEAAGDLGSFLQHLLERTQSKGLQKYLHHVASKSGKYPLSLKAAVSEALKAS